MGVILFLIFLLLFKACKDKDDEDFIVVPIPEVIIKSDTIYVPSPVDRDKDNPKKEYVYKYKDSIVKIPNPINQDLLDKYNQAQDSLSKMKMYIEAIQIREYVTTYENEYYKMNIYSEVQGYMLKEAPEVTIKARSIDIDISKFKKYKLLYGGKIEYNIGTLDNRNPFNVEILGGIKLKNDDVILGSFGVDKSIGAGYLRSF